MRASVAQVEREPGTEEVLEQGDALLRSSRDLLAELDRQLGTSRGRPVNNPGDSLRTEQPESGDS